MIGDRPGTRTQTRPDPGSFFTDPDLLASGPVFREIGSQWRGFARGVAEQTQAWARRAEQASQAVKAIVWTAQKRLCGRYRKLSLERGKPKQVVCTAVARELTGFIWAIAREVQGPALHHAGAGLNGRLRSRNRMMDRVQLSPQPERCL